MTNTGNRHQNVKAMLTKLARAREGAEFTITVRPAQAMTVLETGAAGRQLSRRVRPGTPVRLAAKPGAPVMWRVTVLGKDYRVVPRHLADCL